MTNFAVFPEYRRQGIYAAILRAVMGEVTAEGFQIINSRHVATNSAVIGAKLKHDFVISGMEISDAFGLLVHLSHYTNPTRRKAIAFRSGELFPDAELRQLLGL